MDEWAIMLQDRVIRTFTIDDGMRLTIGRGSDADIVIDNAAISRLHTAIELKDGIYMVADLKSLNGTMVNGEKITSEVPVSKKDVIEFGKFRLVPAEGLAASAAASSATAMDFDDDTVFVTPKAKPAAGERRPVARRPGPRLVVAEGDAAPAEIPLEGKSSIKIGKDPSCDLIVRGWFVAAAQCYLIKRGEKFSIVPQRSWAATRLNGLQIKEERPLHPGDLIEIRGTKIRFE